MEMIHFEENVFQMANNHQYGYSNDTLPKN